MIVGSGGAGASVPVKWLLGHSLWAAARLLDCLGMFRRGVPPVAAALPDGPRLALPMPGRVPLEVVAAPGLFTRPFALVERDSGLLTWAGWHLVPALQVVVPATVVRIGRAEYVFPPTPVRAARVGRLVRTAHPRVHEHDPVAVLLGQLLGLHGLIGLVSVWPLAPAPPVDVEPEVPVPAPVAPEVPVPAPVAPEVPVPAPVAPEVPVPAPVAPEAPSPIPAPTTPSHRPRRHRRPPRLRRAATVGVRWALVAIAVVGVSIGAGHQRSGSRREAAPGGARAAPGAPAGAVPNPLGSGQPVTFAFAGDIHFEGVLRRKLASDPVGLLAPVRPVLASADLTVANLETAVTERGVRQDKQFNFRAPADGFRALKAAGVDVVTLANNHGLDYGLEGLQDTLAAARATRVAVVGAGRDAAEAYAPYRARVKGQRVAVIGATQVLDAHLVRSWAATSDQPGLASAKDVPRLTAEVREARAVADTVVVFLHWGMEGHTCPSPVQVGLARQLVDAGADIVVGGHAHRLQGAGRLGQAFVAYGLGNFVFYARGGPGAESGVLKVTATGRRIDDYHWIPAQIRDGVPRPYSGAQRERALRAWTELRRCTGLAP